MGSTSHVLIIVHTIGEEDVIGGDNAVEGTHETNNEEEDHTLVGTDEDFQNACSQKEAHDDTSVDSQSVSVGAVPVGDESEGDGEQKGESLHPTLCAEVGSGTPELSAGVTWGRSIFQIVVDPESVAEEDEGLEEDDPEASDEKLVAGEFRDSSVEAGGDLFEFFIITGRNDEFNDDADDGEDHGEDDGDVSEDGGCGESVTSVEASETSGSIRVALTSITAGTGITPELDPIGQANEEQDEESLDDMVDVHQLSSVFLGRSEVESVLVRVDVSQSVGNSNQQHSPSEVDKRIIRGVIILEQECHADNEPNHTKDRKGNFDGIEFSLEDLVIEISDKDIQEKTQANGVEQGREQSSGVSSGGEEKSDSVEGNVEQDWNTKTSTN